MSRSRTSSAVAAASVALAISACTDAVSPAIAPDAPADRSRMNASSLAIADARERLANLVHDTEIRAHLTANLRSLDAALVAGRAADARRWLAAARADLSRVRDGDWLGDAELDAISLALDAAADGLQAKESH